jgi:hypothetical protein
MFTGKLLKGFDLLERHFILMVAKIDVCTGENAFRGIWGRFHRSRGMRCVPRDAQTDKAEQDGRETEEERQFQEASA